MLGERKLQIYHFRLRSGDRLPFRSVASISIHRLSMLNYPSGLATVGTFSQQLVSKSLGKLDTKVYEHLQDLIIHPLPKINVLRLY